MTTTTSIDPNDLYEKLNVEKDLVTGFSILFSRFEYALKRRGYVRNNRGYVEVDWTRFAVDNAKKFGLLQHDDVKAAVEYLQERPPKQQVLRDGNSLGWEDRTLQGSSPLEHVIDAIKRVRNNLFHGGKFPMQPIEEPGRNKELLESCITILWACLELDKKLGGLLLEERGRHPII